MAVFSLDIFGRLHDGITGPLGRILGTLDRAAVANRRLAAAQASAANTMPAYVSAMRTSQRATALHAGGVQQLTSAINQQARAVRNLGGAHTVYHRSVGGGGGYGGGRGGGHGGIYAGFPMTTAGIAAATARYSLGGFGPGTLALGAGALLGAASTKKYMSFENALTEVRKAANMTRDGMWDFGADLQKMIRPYGGRQESAANMAATIALGGVRGPGALLGATEEAIRAQLLWRDVSENDTASVLARVSSRWYKNASGPELQEKLRSIVDTIDYFEDNYPTDAAAILKGVNRFLATGKLVGMTPEQAVAQVASMTSLGEPSGERAGTRLGINYPRVAQLMSGKIKRKGLNTKGLDLKGYDSLYDINPQLAVVKFISDLLSKYKGNKRLASDFIAKGLGNETAKNLAPMIAEFDEMAIQLATTNQGIARWVIKQPHLVELLKSFGKAGEKFLQDLEKFAGGPDDPKGTMIPSSDANVAAMRERLQTSINRVRAASDRFLTALTNSGAVEQGAGAIEDTLDAASDQLDRLALNKQRGAPLGVGARVNSVHRPFVPFGGTLLPLPFPGPELAGTAYGPYGQSDGMGENRSGPNYRKPANYGYGGGYSGPLSPDFGSRPYPFVPPTTKGIGKQIGVNAGQIWDWVSRIGKYISDSIITPAHGAGMPAIDVKVPEPQVTVNPIPPPQVNVQAPPGYNVNVTVTGSGQYGSASNPGAGGQSGSQVDPPAQNGVVAP